MAISAPALSEAARVPSLMAGSLARAPGPGDSDSVPGQSSQTVVTNINPYFINNPINTMDTTNIKLEF